MKTDRFLRLAALAGLALWGLVASGCTDMKDQPRYEPLEASTFFENGQSSRPFVEGTVARGHLQADDRFYRGLDENGRFVATMPVAVNAQLLARGQERFNIFCSPCHDRVGTGRGMIVQRGYKQPTSFHDPRLRGIEDGYIFDVISNGFGSMSSYASQVKHADRWAIVAYIRALQLSQNAPLAAVPTDVRDRLLRGEAVDVRPAPADAGGHGAHGTSHAEEDDDVGSRH